MAFVVLMTALSGAARAQATAHFAGVQTVVGSIGTPGSGPRQVAVDLGGNVFIGSPDNGQVLKETLASNGTYTQTDITPSGDGIQGLGTDASGNVYVASTSAFSNLTTLFKLAPSGNSYTRTSTLLGSTSSEVVQGIAVDAVGNVYVIAAGSSSTRILKETLVSGSYTESVILSGLSASVFNIAVDAIGNLFITDATSVIKETYSSGNYVASTIVNGLTGDDTIAVDGAGNLYIGEGNGTVVYKEALNGSTYTQTIVVGGIGSPGGVAVDTAGNVYVADAAGTNTYKEAFGAITYGSQNVGSTHAAIPIKFIFDTGGTIAAPTVVTQGATGLDFAATTGTCISNGINYNYSPGNTCTVNATFTPVASGQRMGAVILKAGGNAIATASVWGIGLAAQVSFLPSTISTVAGNGTSVSTGDGGPATSAGFAGNLGIRFDSKGNLYIADESGDRLRKVDATTGLISTIAGSGVNGFSGDGGPATSGSLNYPSSIALDGAGNLYIADQHNQRIRRVDATTGFISTVVGNGTSADTGNGGLGINASILEPSVLLADPSGNLYISTGGSQVRKLDAVTGIITAVAGTGTQGYTGDGGAAVSALIGEPYGLVLDRTGNLFIGDIGNSVVRRVDAATGIITTVAGNGTYGYSGDGGPATSAAFTEPAGLAIDSAGNLYVSDESNNRVRRVDAVTGIVTTVAGSGTSGYGGDGSLATSAQLGDANSIAFDGQGNLYIGNDSYARVRKLSAATSLAAFGSFSVGTASSANDVKLSNSGNATLNLSGLAPSTNFNLNGSNNTCSTSVPLASGASCILGIRFMPTIAGSLTGTITVTDNANNVSGATQTVALSGTGVALPATQTTLNGVPTTLYVGGNLGTVTVSLRDTNGNPSASTASVTVTITGPGSYSQSVTVSAVNGVATFNLNSLTLSTQGVYTTTATSSGLTSSSATTTVSLPATKTALGGVAVSLLTGGNLGTVTVLIENVNGQVVTGPTATVALTVTGPGGFSLSANATAISGVATFNLSSFPLTVTGVYTTTATSVGLASSSASSTVNPLPTALALSLSSNTATGGNAVVLTATATANSSPVALGQVSFNYTQVVAGITLSGSFGTGQLTNAGTSVLTIRPGFGAYSITAVHPGTLTTAAATSAAQILTVTGTPYSTVTGIAATGAPGNYTVTATVGQFSLLDPPAGAVSFLNTSASNQSVATANIDPATQTFGVVPATGSPLPNAGVSFVATGDVNGDGITDLITTSGTTMQVQLGLSNGVFGTAASYDFNPGSAGISSVTIADVNNDGNADLLVVSQYQYKVFILLGNGTGTFTVPGAGPQVIGVQSPASLTVADLNRDGNLDFVTSDPASGAALVFLGNGDGSFQPEAGYGAGGGYPIGVAVADFNQDGVPDLAVSKVAGSVGILLGNGDGTFQPQVSLPDPGNNGVASPVSLRGNGVVDLLAPAGAGFLVYLGNNDGTFAPAVQYNTTYPIQAITFTPYSHNGLVDLIALSSGVNSEGLISYFASNGDGTFAAQQDYPGAGAGSGAFAAADFNSDGQLDFAVSNTSDGTVSILLAQQTVTATATAVSVPGPFAQLIEARYAGDSNHASSISSTISLLPPASTTILTATPARIIVGSSTTLTAKITSTLSSVPNAGAVAFYNGGTLIATVNVVNGTATYTPGNLSIGSSTFSAVFSGSAEIGNSTSNNLTVYVALLSTTELSLSPTAAVANAPVTLTATSLQTPGATPVTAGEVSFNYQQTVGGVTRQGTFGSAQITPTGTATLTVRPAAGTYTVTAQFIGTRVSAASSSQPQTLVVASSLLPTMSSIAATGSPENYTLTGTVGQFGMLPPTGTVSFLDTTAANQSVGTATIDPATLAYDTTPAGNISTPNTRLRDVFAGDLNGDGIADVITVLRSGSTRSIQIQLGTGNGLFQAPVTYVIGNGGLYPINIKDVNGDGKADLVMLNTGAGAIIVLLGDGTGNFTVPPFTPGPQFIPVVGSPNWLTIADVNNDGIPDLLTADVLGGTASVFFGSGNGTFQAQVSYGAGSYPSSVKTGDLNHDGNLDLVISSYSSGVKVLLGNGDGTFQTATTIPGSTPAYTVAVGSLRGNGVVDIVMPDASFNGFDVYAGNNDATFASPVNHPFTYDPGDFFLEDVDRDGKLDVVALTFDDNAPYPAYLAIVRGNGDGTFGTEQVFDFGQDSGNMVIADFNNDGLPDFIESDELGTTPILYGRLSERATATGITVPGPASQNIAANYAGDTSHAASISTTIPLLPPSSTIALSATPRTSLGGAPVTLTATIGAMLSSFTTGGAVSFYAGSNLLSTVNVTGTTATYTSTSLPFGSTNLSAVFSGSTTLAPSTSNSVQVFVVPSSSTTLAVSPSAAATGTPITLTATGVLLPGTAPVTSGTITYNYQQTLNGVTLQGSFGTAQFTSAGTAAITVEPGVGTYLITAAFAGTTAAAPSNSAAQTVTITGAGTYGTATGISASGTPGNYTLTGNVGVFGQVPATGTVSFLDNTAGGGAVGSGVLNPATPGVYGLIAPNPPAANANITFVATGDVNGDGKPDLISLLNDYSNPGEMLVQFGNGNGTFQAPVTYTTNGGSLNNVVLGDLNHDGLPDLIVSSSDQNYPGGPGDAVLILLNTGAGAFQTPTGAQVLAAGETPSFVAVGDLNQDGKLDIAVTNQASQTVGIFLGNGDGTFSSQVSHPVTGESPYGVTIADYTGDGTPDLEVTTLGSYPSIPAKIEILTGAGDGNFTSSNVFSPPGNNFPVTAVSLRHNGIFDLIVPDGYDTGIYVYLGTGTGAFAAPIIIPTTYAIQNLVIADLDHDGKLDIAGDSYASNGAPGQVSLFLGNGDGTFGLEQDFPIGSSPNNIAMADFNHDGLMDFVSSNADDGTSTVLLGAQFRSVSATGVTVPGPGPQAIVASYSGDSAHTSSISGPITLLPIVTTTVLSATPPSATPGALITLAATVVSTLNGPANGGTVTFSLHGTVLATANVVNGTASFTTSTLPVGYDRITAVYSGTTVLGISIANPLLLFIGPQNTTSLTVSNNTAIAGTPIVLTATVANSPAGTPLTPGQVSFNYLLTAGGVTLPGTFGTFTLTSAGTAAATVRPTSGVYVVTAVFAGTSLAGPSLSAPQTVTVTGNPAYLSTTTLTSTGSQDDYTLRATISGFGLTPPTGTVSFLNTTNANAVIASAVIDPSTIATTMVPATGSPSASPDVTFATTADLNNDGVADLVIAACSNGTGSIAAQLGVGNGTFHAAIVHPVNFCATTAAVGDLNGDGKPDLAIVGSYDGVVGILLGAGDGTFTLQTPLLEPGASAPYAQPLLIVLADLNHDGRLDVIVANQAESTVSVFLSNGNGTFAAQQLYPIGAGPASLAIADLDANGTLDILVSNQQDSTIGILLGVGDGTFHAQTTIDFPHYSSAASLAVGSLRNNGIVDFIAPDQYGPAVQVFLGNNDGTFAVPVEVQLSDTVTQAVLTDADHDGKLDLVVAYFDRIGVLHGLGDGTFGPETDFVTGQTPNNAQATIGLAAADFNNDGLPDIVTASTVDSTLAVMLGSRTAMATATHVFVTGTGTQNVNAGFPGDATHAASLSATVPLQPSAQVASATSLSTSATTILSGGSVTFTATIAPVPTGAARGTVSFFSNGTLLGTANVAASGVATFTTAALPAGTDAVTATYSGNAALLASTASPLNIIVMTATATTLSVSSSTGPYGQPVVLTATVAPSPTGSATGTVSFYKGSTLLGTASLNPAGVAAFTVSTLGLGVNSLTAVYSGNTLAAASTSPAFSYTVIQAATTTVLTSATQTIATGQTAVLTATVNPAPSDTPSGTISFYNGSTLLGTSSLTGGVATLSVSTLPNDANILTAVFSGSTDFAGSTSAPLTVSGSRQTSTALTSSTLNSAYGQAIVLTASISPAPTAATRGTVSFYSGSSLLGTASVSTAGMAAFSVATLQVGANPVTAAYSGSPGLSASTSAPLAITITAATTSTTVASSSQASIFGQTISLTATVSPASTDSQRGTVSFYTGSTLLGTAPLISAGSATLNNVVLPLGPNAIKAIYSGSASFAASTSTPLAVSARASTATTFSASPTTQLYNNPIRLIAQVASSAAGAPGGTVSFLDGTTVVGTSPVNSAGQAVFTSVDLVPGAHNLTAAYLGDTSFLTSSSTGAPIAITVADLNLALGGDNNKSVVPGDPVTYNFPLSPLVTPTFIYDVTLTATGLPPGATYTFSPAVIPAGSKTLPVAFTVQTAAQSASRANPATRTGEWTALALGLLLPFGGSKRVRARLKAMPRPLCLLVFGVFGLGLMSAVTGCGAGGFAGSSLSGKSFTITVHATSADLVRTSTVQLNFK